MREVCRKPTIAVCSRWGKQRRALLAKTIATVSPPPAAPPPFPSSPLMDLAYENYQPGFGLLLVIALCGLVCLAACALCRLRRRREESCSRGRCSECCHGLLCTSHRRLSRWWPPELTRTPRGLRRVAVTYRLRVPASRVRYVPEAQGGLPPGPHVLHVLARVRVPASAVPYARGTAGGASSSRRATSTSARVVRDRV